MINIKKGVQDVTAIRAAWDYQRMESNQPTYQLDELKKKKMNSRSKKSNLLFYLHFTIEQKSWKPIKNKVLNYMSMFVSVIVTFCKNINNFNSFIKKEQK